MGTRREQWLVCDHPECNEPYAEVTDGLLAGYTMDVQRRIAVRQGWECIRHKGKRLDLCPEHKGWRP